METCKQLSSTLRVPGTTRHEMSPLAYLVLTLNAPIPIANTTNYYMQQSTMAMTDSGPKTRLISKTQLACFLFKHIAWRSKNVANEHVQRMLQRKAKMAPVGATFISGWSHFTRHVEYTPYCLLWRRPPFYFLCGKTIP